MTLECVASKHFKQIREDMVKVVEDNDKQILIIKSHTIPP